ncbi:Pentatricopeptide repeat-containing protein [Cynara cardunculus var. scolymus]|uniref:Pentatricopeptide repeat-containing protein n=2 Tax=Cynara cardunculus var. scolymus TaxID=59895 RepID=A0A103XGT4_CYNCS|nr:Pentatricopeptide repeat-containing protein [Cynara cardunculus var. scolymus]
MMKGFKISKLICFTISDYSRQHQSLGRTRHHVDSPLFRLFSSSSYNNRSNDGGRPPPPRRRSGSTSDRPPSSSRLSGFIDGNDDRGAGDNRGRGHGGGRRDFDTNRKPNYQNHGEYRPSNRASYEVNNTDHRKSESNSCYVPFDDDEQKPPISPRRGVNDNKIQDVDGFLDRFKLGFDQENKPNSDKLDSSRGTGEGEAVAEAPPPSPPPPPPPEDADEIFRKMKETGLIPNAVAMLHGLCSDGLVQEAMKLFGLMRERGSIPEVVVYTAVVEGFCKSQKPDEAMRIFKKMQNNGIVPNAFSYGVLVQGLYKGKRLDEALEFCVEMVEAGHSPNLATFTGLVNGFCRERGLEAAETMINNLKEKGFGFDEKAVREFMEKKGPFLPLVWEAILGKKSSQMF